MTACGGSTLLSLLRRYLSFTAIGHLAWEGAQMPLYTLWWTGSGGEIGFAILHCTGGDLLIAALSLLAALALMGPAWWPARQFRRVAVTAVIFGLGYTIWSEYLNVFIRHSWSYTDAMPVVPWLGVGLTPLLQWLVVPAGALNWAGRQVLRGQLPVISRDLVPIGGTIERPE